jgi:hypothetical protein
MAANCSPTSLAVIKQQVLSDLDCGYFDGLARSYRSMAYMSTSADFREGIDSLLEKRPPTFPPLASDFDPAKVTGADIPGQDIIPMDYMGSPPR